MGSELAAQLRELLKVLVTEVTPSLFLHGFPRASPRMTSRPRAMTSRRASPLGRNGISRPSQPAEMGCRAFSCASAPRESCDAGVSSGVEAPSGSGPEGRVGAERGTG